MIEEIDETLRELVKREALNGSQVDIAFDAPTKDWAARRNAPAVNLYLYDIREDLSRRDAAWYPTYDPEGLTKDHRPLPRRYKLSYLVTAWTQRPEDEHRLLSACLHTFLRHETIAPPELRGPLHDQPLAVEMTVALPLGPDRSIADVWSALGGELKPSLDLVVISPFVIGRSVQAGPPVLETPRVGVAGPEAEERVGGGRPAAARRVAAGDAPVLETVQAGTEAHKGRIVHVRGIPRTPAR
jgi:Pvc16 N-terminal domain